MLGHFLDWLNILFRWIHIVAGIAWIGSSFFFMWLDAALTRPQPDRKNVTGELWMTHSGGFYQVEKRKIGPGEMPQVLHWFKWEAAFTWMTGIILLLVVYYFTGGIYLIDPLVSNISVAHAMSLGIGLIILSWAIYDFLFSPRLEKHVRLSSTLALILLGGVTFVLTKYLSGRAAFIHVGAILGTLMVANVWMRILPAQRKMIAATERGETPDFSLGEKAKRRSVHNNYMTFPVIFIMFSNHFPNTYGHSHNWIILILIMLAGAGVKHVMNVGKRALWLLAPVTVLVVILFAWTDPYRNKTVSSKDTENASNGVVTSFPEIQNIVNTRCLPCHSQNPSDKTFGIMPAGISFDDPANIKKYSERIMVRAVQFKTMPLGNKTEMTEEEREKLGGWIKAGANLE